MKKLWLIFVTLLVCAGFTTSAMGGLTISSKDPTTVGKDHAMMLDVAFDSSYASGGESFDYTKYGFNAVSQIHIFDKYGYNFEYDYTNKKIKVFAPAPGVVFEETHIQDATTQGFYTDYPAAFIVSIVNSGGTAYPLMYAGGTTTMTVNAAILPNGIDDGERTFIQCKISATSKYVVTYATQAWQDLYSLYVENELLTGTGVTRVTVSGNTMFAFMCATEGGSATPLRPIDWVDTAGASEICVDLGDYANAHSGATQSVNKVATGGQAVYMTYLKHPGSQAGFVFDRYVRDEDATSGASIHSLDKPLALWLIGGHVLMNGDPPHEIVLENQLVFFNRILGSYLGGGYGSTGTSEVNTNWGYRGIAADGVTPNDSQVWASVDEANGTDLTHATYIYGHPWEIPNLKPLEVPDGSNLSDLSGVKVLIIGR